MSFSRIISKSGRSDYFVNNSFLQLDISTNYSSWGNTRRW